MPLISNLLLAAAVILGVLAVIALLGGIAAGWMGLAIAAGICLVLGVVLRDGVR